MARGRQTDMAAVLLRQQRPVPVTPEAEAGGCCAPVCGPDTYGSGQPVLVTIEPAPAEQPPAQAGGCCEPDCGPDTCA